MNNFIIFGKLSRSITKECAIKNKGFHLETEDNFHMIFKQVIIQNQPNDTILYLSQPYNFCLKYFF